MTKKASRAASTLSGGRRAFFSARGLAWEALNRVEQRGAWAEAWLEARLPEAGLSPADARLAWELSLGTIKFKTFLDYALKPYLSKPGALPGPARTLLRLGAYQLLLLSKIPPHAAVHATVELAKSRLSLPHVRLVNAVLRALSRQGAPALPDPKDDPAAHAAVRYSLPLFLAERWLARFGPVQAAAMFEAANEAPPLAARVNLGAATREQALAGLAAAGVQAEPGLLPESLLLQREGRPAQWPGLAEGWLYFQDQASQLVGRLADPQPGQVCLDLCSAPGGKATHLAELLKGTGQVLAYDSHPQRLQRVEENARRLRLENLRTLSDLPPEVRADRVLVDAPCSGLGTLRRHAEARWRVQAGDFARMAAGQLALLDQAAGFVKPGGHLVYSTCTTEPEENEDVVARFAETHPAFRLLAGPGSGGQPDTMFWGGDGLFRTFPGHPELDGLFAARWVREEK
ncbi:MAG: 16S rRNA (cytosine(967)-C(5))-methyltransferase RsmB [candidate division FCPU426 bacterium]